MSPARRAFLAAAALFASGCPVPTSRGPETRPELAPLKLPEREVVEAFEKSSGDLYAFLSAPGARVAVLRSEDGRAWERVSFVDRAGQIYGVVFTDPDRALVLHGGVEGAVLYRLTDRGRKWSELTRVPGRYVRLREDGSDLFLVGGDARGRASVLRTRDGVELVSAAEFADEPPALVADRARFGARTVLVGGGGGKGAIFVSESGAPFRRVPPLEIPNLLAVDFDSAGHGLAVGARGEALRSANGGATWEPVLSGTDSDLAGVVFLSDGHAYACGKDGTVLSTTDGGASFRRVAIGRGDDYFGFRKSDHPPGVRLLGARGMVPFLPPP